MNSHEMQSKVFRVAKLTLVSAFLAVAVYLASKRDIVTLAGVALSAPLGIALERLSEAILDLVETSNWKNTRRKLARGGVINSSTLIRISFAYLFRIKVGNQYLLILNGRNTGKYQPVGGVYKMRTQEKKRLQNLYHVVDDDKIPIDKSSRDDYRLYVPNRYLKRFVRRFDKKAERETIRNLGREFREELIDAGILHWDSIEYRYCGRHITDLQYEKHFQTYELLLADIVELCPQKAQVSDLKRLVKQHPDTLRFATADEILRLGVKTEECSLSDSIASHTYKMLQEEEFNLLSPPGTGSIFSAKFARSTVFQQQK